MQFPAPSETFTANDVLMLNKLEQNVTVFSMKSNHVQLEQLVEDRLLENIPIHHGGFKNICLGLLEILKRPFLFFILIFWILKNEITKPRHLVRCIALIPISFFILKKLTKLRPEIVHLFWGHYPSIVGFLIKRKLPEVKLSVFLGAYDLNYKLGISRDILKQADTLFTHVSVNVPFIQKLGSPTIPINVVYRGTNLDKNLSYINNKTKNEYLWISVGRLLPVKRFNKVFEVFQKAKSRNKNLSLEIIGEGLEESNLKKISSKLGLNKSILFKGHLKHSLVIKKMASADVCILLSSTERLPNVIKEAMLSGCICVVSVTPGIEELVEHGKTGFIFRDNDFDKIPDILSALSISEKERIRENARKFIIENFSVEVSMKKYIKIWEGSLLNV